MKLLYDYLPILIFFITFKFFGIFIATGVYMIATVLQVGIYWLMHRKFEKIHLINLGLSIILGGSTLLFHSVLFIKWKPSIFYWIFSALLISSQFVGKKTLVQRLLEDKISMPIKIWSRLNLSWGVFFLLLGFLNLYVAYNYSTNAWVNFKLFGTLALIIVFMIGQGIYMSRHMEANKLDKKEGEN